MTPPPIASCACGWIKRENVTTFPTGPAARPKPTPRATCDVRRATCDVFYSSNID